MTTKKAAVYFILCTGSHLIKIGRSYCPPERHRTLEMGNPSTLVVLGLEQDRHDAEVALHRRFADARVRGEWFRPIPELMTHIQEKTLPPIQYYATLKELTLWLEKYPRFFHTLDNSTEQQFPYVFTRPHTITPPLIDKTPEDETLHTDPITQRLLFAIDTPSRCAGEPLHKWEKVRPASRTLPQCRPAPSKDEHEALARMEQWEHDHPGVLLIPHAQVASILGVGISTVQHLTTTGELKTVRISKNKGLLRVADVRNLLAS